MAVSNVLVVIPALNEAGSIGTVIEDVRRHGHKLLVVDDGSIDSTADLSSQAGADVLRLPFNLGVGGALRAGFRFAVEGGFDAVVQCDADGQHPAEHIDELIDAAARMDAHMVIGSRFAKGSESLMRVNMSRRLAMRVLASTASRATGTQLSDVTSGFRVIQGELLVELARLLPDYYLGDTYECVVAAGRAGFTIREIPAPIGDRTHGRSTASTIQAIRLTLRAFMVSVLRLHVRLRPPHSQEV